MHRDRLLTRDNQWAAAAEHDNWQACRVQCGPALDLHGCPTRLHWWCGRPALALQIYCAHYCLISTLSCLQWCNTRIGANVVATSDWLDLSGPRPSILLFHGESGCLLHEYDQYLRGYKRNWGRTVIHHRLLHLHSQCYRKYKKFWLVGIKHVYVQELRITTK